MQAFIPAAGLGTRLLTLTEHRPKALVEVGGVPLLKIAIDNLVRQRVTRIVVNVHHFADMLIDYLQSYDWGTEVLVSNEKVITWTYCHVLTFVTWLSCISRMAILSRLQCRLGTPHVSCCSLTMDCLLGGITGRQGRLSGWVNPLLSIEHLHSVELQYSTRVFWRYFLRVRFPIRLFPLTLILPKNIESVISSIVLRIGWTLGPLSH